MRQEQREKRQMGTKVLEPPQPPKNIPPPVNRERNEFGDFIVTTIEIPDLKKKELEEDKDDSEDEEESEEEPQPEEESKEEVKPKEKKLSKKEQKKLEDEEFERVMKEMGVKEQAQA